MCLIPVGTNAVCLFQLLDVGHADHPNQNPVCMEKFGFPGVKWLERLANNLPEFSEKFQKAGITTQQEGQGRYCCSHNTYRVRKQECA